MDPEPKKTTGKTLSQTQEPTLAYLTARRLALVLLPFLNPLQTETAPLQKTMARELEASGFSPAEISQTTKQIEAATQAEVKTMAAIPHATVSVENLAALEKTPFSVAEIQSQSEFIQAQTDIIKTITPTVSLLTRDAEKNPEQSREISQKTAQIIVRRLRDQVGQTPDPGKIISLLQDKDTLREINYRLEKMGLPLISARQAENWAEQVGPRLLPFASIVVAHSQRYLPQAIMTQAQAGEEQMPSWEVGHPGLLTKNFFNSLLFTLLKMGHEKKIYSQAEADQIVQDGKALIFELKALKTPAVKPQILMIEKQIKQAQKLVGVAKHTQTPAVLEVKAQIAAQFKNAVAKVESQEATGAAQTKSAKAALKKFTDQKDVQMALALTQEQKQNRLWLIKSIDREIDQIKTLAEKTGVNLDTEIQKLETLKKEIFQGVGRITPPEEITLKQQKVKAQQAEAQKTVLQKAQAEHEAKHPAVKDYQEHQAKQKKAAFTHGPLTQNLEDRETWSRIADQGLFAKDLRLFRKKLEQTGVPADHPLLKQVSFLEAKHTRVETIIKQHYPRLWRFTQKFWEQKSQLGRSEAQAVFIPELGGYLPKLSIKPLKNKAWQFFLKTKLGQKVNSFLSTKLYRAVKIGPYRIRRYLSSRFLSFITRGRLVSFSQAGKLVFKKTLGKAAAWLAKTSIGKAVISGLTKLATKAATKLGVQLAVEGGLVAAGTTVGGPVGALIGIAVNLLIEIGKKLLRPVIDLFKKAIRKLKEHPELLIFSAPVLFVLLPGPLKMLALAPLVAGAAGLLSGVLAGAGGGLIATGLAFLTIFFGGPTVLGVSLFLLAILALIALLTIFIVMVVSGAFIVPATPGDLTPAPGEEYFEVIKTANPNKIPKIKVGETAKVQYQIKVTAEEDIKITGVIDERWVSCQGQEPDLKSKGIEPVVVFEVDPGPTKNWSTEYELVFDSDFMNCRFCNTVTVTANVGLKTGLTVSDTECVEIGEAPDDCPSGWPTREGYITQGPNVDCPSHLGVQAIDIGVVVGTSVYSTHEGTITDIREDVSGCRGAHWVVIVEGQCHGPFKTSYYHLKSINNLGVTIGAHVDKGTIIGTSGNCGGGPHLHYQFNDLKMAPPNIPVSVGPCCGADECNISWL